jgi:hypothetical protein
MAEETGYAGLEEGSLESRRDIVAVCSKAHACLDRSQSMIPRIWGMSLINFALSINFTTGLHHGAVGWVSGLEAGYLPPLQI